MVSVVVFCGGRGSTTILRSLARTSNVELSVIVNAYDAGLSTGRVRKAFPGLLGPSDLRKTAGTLANAVGDERSRTLVKLFEARLASDPSGLSVEADARAKAQLTALVEGQLDGLEPPISDLVRTLSVDTWLNVKDALTSFQKGLLSVRTFAHDDLAIGNAVLAGLFLSTGSLTAAVDEYQDLLALEHQRVQNVTRGEDLWLSARAGSMYCPDEGTLVSARPPSPISDLFLLPREDHDRLFNGSTEWIDRSSLQQDPALLETLPLLDDSVARKIAGADVIVYGPGTQHSSLLPTYMTVGLGEAIAENTRAEKIFVTNIEKDTDQHEDDTVKSYIDRFKWFISRRHATDVSLEHYVSTVLVGNGGAASLGALPAGVRVRQAVWADSGGLHSGPAVKEEIASVVRLRSGEQLPGDSGLASLIIPVLNEATRIPAVLQQLRFLDLSELGLLQEIIIVDGGSSDGTLEFLRQEPGIILLERNCRGRGDAIRAGLASARGEYVVSFPADGEYDVHAIAEILGQLISHPEAAVLASRALGGSTAGQRLREIYADNRALYVLSHWGGVTVTMLLMFRLDCVVGDPLSGVRGACRGVFRQLDNAGSGLDYDVRWVRRAVAGGRTVIEVPTVYRPRSWREGKKTTVFDGLRALSSTLSSREKVAK